MQNIEEKEIPKKYKETFGENVSYFFEYKKVQNKMTFNDFTLKKGNQIKEDIIQFFKGKKKLLFE